MKNKENNYAFIDSQNLNLSIRRLGWQLDFGKFNIYLKDKYGIKKSYLFIGYKEKNPVRTEPYRALFIVIDIMITNRFFLSTT